MTDTKTIKTPLWQDLIKNDILEEQLQPLNINIIKTISKFYKGVLYENRKIKLCVSHDKEIYIKHFDSLQYYSDTISDYISLKETIEKNSLDIKKYRKSFIKETLKKLNFDFDDKIINFSIYTDNNTILEYRDYYFNKLAEERNNLFENNH